MSRFLPALDWVERKLREVRRRLDRAELELRALEGRPLGPLGIVPVSPTVTAALRIVGCNGAYLSGVAVVVTDSLTGDPIVSGTTDTNGFFTWESPNGRDADYAATGPTGFDVTSGTFTWAQITGGASTNPKTVTLTVTPGYACVSAGSCSRPIRLNGSVTDQFGTTTLTWAGSGFSVANGTRDVAGTVADPAGLPLGCGSPFAGNYRINYTFSSAGLAVSTPNCSGFHPRPAGQTSGTSHTATVGGTNAACGPPYSSDHDFTGTAADGADRIYQAGSKLATFTEVP